MSDHDSMDIPSEGLLAKEAKALHMRRKGRTYQEIADACGYANRGTAHRTVLRAIGRTLRESADDLRMIENERLDRAQAAIWDKIELGDTEAVRAFLRISLRRAKMNGLDVATKHEITGAGGNPLIIEFPSELLPREPANDSDGE